MRSWRTAAWRLGALSLAGAFASVAGAQTITDPTKPPSPTPPVVTPATPANPTPQKAPSPFSFTYDYSVDLLDNVSGGLRPGQAYVALLKGAASYDGSAVGHDGLTGLVSLIYANGVDFTANRVGALQAVSSLEAQPGAFRLYEAWLAQDILGGKGGVKAGLIDLNTTFDVQETAALFINSSSGIGPEFGDTGLNGPSNYPLPSLAVTAFYRPADDWTAQVGLFDGVAGDPNHRANFFAISLSARDGALIVAQLEKRFGEVARIEGGVWAYTSSFPALSQVDAAGQPRQLGGNAGFYGLVEGRLFAKPGGGGDGGLSGWLRAGGANGQINRITSYVGAGLVYTGLFRGRPSDAAGVAISRAGLGVGISEASALQGRPVGGAETNIEATYRFGVKSWLTLQPDVQYVIDPGGDRRLGDALVVGLRIAITGTR